MLGIFLVLAPVVIPLGAWFLLLLLPAAVLCIPALVIFGIGMLPTLVVSATHHRGSAAPRPPASRPAIAAT